MIQNFQWHEVAEILKNAVYITGLVIIMMLLIEYVNVATHGRRFESLQKSSVKQVLLGALLGVIPGCMGGFVAVSLFSHNIFGLGGLIAAMISDTGDETFVMFAVMPVWAVVVKATMFVLGVGVGIGVNLFVARRHRATTVFSHNLEIHDSCEHDADNSLAHNVRHLTLSRILILLGLLAFIVSLAFGLLEHSHAAHEFDAHDAHTHDSGLAHVHGDLFSERWLNLLFLIVAMGAFVMVLSVNGHFLREHIVRHVIAKHLLRVFLWTAGALMFIYAVGLFIDYRQWTGDNRLTVLLLALLIGLIPESGPHLVFVYLFLQGTLPFSVLLANSAVQNGHSGLPLLAESKSGFAATKLIALGVGAVIGIAGYIFEF